MNLLKCCLLRGVDDASQLAQTNLQNYNSLRGLKIL